MTTKKLTKKALAQAFRLLARDYEMEKTGGFTCNSVQRRISWEARRSYDEAFELSYSNDIRLWKLPVAEERDLRIMMLCMAAAMAETGDLHA